MDAVEESAAMISFVAAGGAFGPVPDIVLCGINHGPNTGHAILHSGTVSAAFTGATHGTPGTVLNVNVNVNDIAAEESEETDAGLLGRGWATATALRAPFEAAEVDINTLLWTR